MLLTIDFTSDIPIYLQIRNQIVTAIAEGRLQPGDRLPSIRALAEESGINMMTVSKSYQILKKEGWLQSDRRSGTVVAEKKRIGIPEKTLDALRMSIYELRASGFGKDDILKLCAKMYEEES